MTKYHLFLQELNWQEIDKIFYLLPCFIYSRFVPSNDDNNVHVLFYAT